LSVASGAVAALVENTGNRAQAVAARSQFTNCGESRPLGRVRLDMDAVDRQSIAILYVSNPLALATLVPQSIARALTEWAVLKEMRSLVLIRLARPCFVDPWAPVSPIIVAGG
jgi:hypothetical protein